MHTTDRRGKSPRDFPLANCYENPCRWDATNDLLGAFTFIFKDLDSEQKLVRIQELEKGSNPRVLRISDKLLSVLNSLPKESLKIFGGKVPAPRYQESFNRFRRKAAAKLQNSRLLQIHYYTLRH